MCLREKIGPDPRNFNQRVSLGRNDLLIRTFLRFFTENRLQIFFQRRHLIRILLFALSIFDKLHNRFRQRDATTARQGSQALPNQNSRSIDFYAYADVLR